MLGIREPEIYGKQDYTALVEFCKKACSDLSEKYSCTAECEIYQSNHEGDLVDWIQESYKAIDGIVINPGAYTHTSIAILDAAKAVGIPMVEVHISDVDSREKFRQISYIREACIKTITGHGINGYLEAIDYLLQSDEK